MMPFRSDATTVKFWTAMHDAGNRYEYLDVDRFGHRRSTKGLELFEAIRHQISQSDFCIADFTLEGRAPNLNVLTEAGLAKGMDKPLYLIARGDYDAVKAGLPSDWNGQYIEAFSDSNKNNWPSKFNDFFERILKDLDRPLELAQEKARTTDAQQLVWMMKVVEVFRDRCRALYEDTKSTPWSAKGKPLQGLPQRYVFALANEDYRHIRVTVGAFFDLWQRGQTPFGVLIENVGAVDVGPTLRTVSSSQLGRNLRRCTTDDVVEALVELLDEVLMQHQQDMDRPTVMARLVCSLDADALVIKEVCAGQAGLSALTKYNKWAMAGFLPTFNVAATQLMLRVGIDFRHWANRGRSPCWIWILPAEHQSPDILSQVRLPSSVRRMTEAGAILVPVPRGGDFRKNLATRLSAVVAACQGTISEPVEEGTFEDDTVMSAPADDIPPLIGLPDAIPD